MTPTKLLIGQIIVVFAIVLAGVWFATQLAAAALAYQPELGRPWFMAFGHPVYQPWALFGWWFSYEAYAPIIFEKAGGIAAASGLVGCAAAIFGSLWRARQRRNVTTYGSARWATAKDIRAAGLLTDSSVFLGRTEPHYLRHDGPEHIMAFAPTRSGKGGGLVVPTLLGWSGSTVIHDIKGENWQLTAGWRQRFSHCLLFNPTDARSARYNPLLEVRRGVNEVRDVQNIADILVDLEGALERRSHWEKTSHSLLVGAILHILYAEEDKTLARVASFVAESDRALDLFASFMPEVRALDDIETLTFLHGTISELPHPVAVPATPIYLDALLVDTPLTGGLEPRLGDTHFRTLTVLGFPSMSRPGILDALNHQDFGYRWVTRFIALDKSDATKALTKLRRQWFNKRKSIAALLREIMYNRRGGFRKRPTRAPPPSASSVPARPTRASSAAGRATIPSIAARRGAGFRAPGSASRHLTSNRTSSM